MTDSSEATTSSKTLIDCHVHVAALPDGNNGCYISTELLKSPLFRLLVWKHGLDVSNPRDANQKYVDDLRNELRQSIHVGKAVLLGMDGVYDAAVSRINRRLNSWSGTITSYTWPTSSPRRF